MKLKKLLNKFLCCTTVFMLCACNLFANVEAPYSISGEMTLTSSPEYENAGFDFSFFNRSEKNVVSFTIVFFLFDEDGNSPLIGRNNIVIKVETEVDSYSSINKTVSLDKFLPYVPGDPYEVDYLYVSNITYSDGTVWQDPLGFAVF